MQNETLKNQKTELKELQKVRNFMKSHQVSPCDDRMMTA